MGLFPSRNQNSLGPDSRRKISIYLLPDIETTCGTRSPAGLPEVAGSPHHSGVLLWDTLYHNGCYGDGGVYQQCQTWLAQLSLEGLMLKKWGLTPHNLSLDVLLIREHHWPELKQDLQVLFQTRAIPEGKYQRGPSAQYGHTWRDTSCLHRRSQESRNISSAWEKFHR